MILVGAVPSVSTGQLKWQNDRTGRVSWQRPTYYVTPDSIERCYIGTVNGAPRRRGLRGQVGPVTDLAPPVSSVVPVGYAITVVSKASCLPVRERLSARR